MTIGEQIKARRVERGWTQAKLSEHSGVGQWTITRAETGAAEVGNKSLHRLKTALGLATDPTANGAPHVEPDDAGPLGEPTQPLPLKLANREIKAMHTIVATLKDLPAESTRRIVDWLREVVNQ